MCRAARNHARATTTRAGHHVMMSAFVVLMVGSQQGVLEHGGTARPHPREMVQKIVVDTFELLEVEEVAKRCAHVEISDCELRAEEIRTAGLPKAAL